MLQKEEAGGIIFGLQHQFLKLFLVTTTKCLTPDGADVMVVIATAVAGVTVLVTSAAGDLIVIGLIA